MQTSDHGYGLTINGIGHEDIAYADVHQIERIHFKGKV
jgi:hypothetical protein